MLMPIRVTEDSLPGENLRISAAISKLYPLQCYRSIEDWMQVLGILAYWR